MNSVKTHHKYLSAAWLVLICVSILSLNSCEKSDAFDAVLGVYDVTYYNYLEEDTIITSVEIKKAGFNCIQFEGTQIDNIKFKIDDLGFFENGDCGENRPHTIGLAYNDSLSIRSYAGPGCVIPTFFYTGTKR